MLGGRIVAAWLKAQGVEKLFALSGEHVLPVFDGCAEEGIDVIATRHEQGAVLAAEAYARVTGKPGVAVVTAGPGVTNAVTGLAVANTCGSPVMLLSGRTSTKKRLSGTFQDVDGRPITTPVTKWSDTVFDTERIPTYLEAAWRRMVGGRPGAVFLELPHDVLKGDAEAPVSTVRFAPATRCVPSRSGR
jgi:acetolactate synthase-1/2/3 large subunit